MVGRVVGEAGHAQPVGGEAGQVHFGHEELRLGGEALRLGEKVAVLVDQGVTVPGEVGGRLARTRGRVEVGRHASGRLGCAEQPPVVPLGHEGIGRGEVDEDRGARQRRIAARRCGNPHVLADLEVKRQALDLGRREQEIGPEGDAPSEEGHLGCQGVASRGELSLLVELSVVGQVALGHHPDGSPSVDDHRAVEESPRHHEGRADHEGAPQIDARPRDALEPVDDGIEQGALVEQVVRAVAGEPELGEGHQEGVLLIGAPSQVQGGVDVGLGIANSHAGHPDGHPHEAVSVQRVPLLQVDDHVDWRLAPRHPTFARIRLSHLPSRVCTCARQCPADGPPVVCRTARIVLRLTPARSRRCFGLLPAGGDVWAALIELNAVAARSRPTRRGTSAQPTLASTGGLSRSRTRRSARPIGHPEGSGARSN